MLIKLSEKNYFCDLLFKCNKNVQCFGHIVTGDKKWMLYNWNPKDPRANKLNAQLYQRPFFSQRS